MEIERIASQKLLWNQQLLFLHMVNGVLFNEKDS